MKTIMPNRLPRIAEHLGAFIVVYCYVCESNNTNKETKQYNLMNTDNLNS